MPWEVRAPGRSRGAAGFHGVPLARAEGLGTAAGGSEIRNGHGGTAAERIPWRMRARAHRTRTSTHARTHAHACARVRTRERARE